MAGKLILVPPSRALLPDAEPIGAGYPRDYTPDEMRRWADDLDQLYKVAEEDRSLPPGERRLDRWAAADRSQLPDDARRVMDAHDKFLADSGPGIKGALREDGTVELYGGKHRAHYIMERGGEPVPVWVSSRDPAALERFEEGSRVALESSRPELAQTDLVTASGTRQPPARAPSDRTTAAPERAASRDEGGR